MRNTVVTIHGDDFHVNDSPTYPGVTWNGKRIEGLLLNSRMVQATFDDGNQETRHLWDWPDRPWDADAHTQECVAAMESWNQAGLNSFTINLQGGSPFGYSREQPWHNSAFDSDGSLRPDYMARVAKVLTRADELEMAVILGLFYFGQFHRCSSDQSVRSGVNNIVRWIAENGFRNVLLELGNEVDIDRPVWGYGKSLVSAARTPELIAFAREVAKDAAPSDWRMPISTSLKGGSVPDDSLLNCVDYVLLHGNGVQDPDRIAEMVRLCRSSAAYRGQPILFNEDDHYGFDAPLNNMIASVYEHAGWGFFDYRRSHEGWNEGFQSVPVNWSIDSPRKRAFFSLVAKITGAKPLST